MTTKFFLIRHAETDVAAHILSGRTPGVHLSTTGKLQAQRLAKKLSSFNITKIASSPLERTLETAAPLAQLTGMEIDISSALNELDFGDWTGQKFVDLQSRENWKQWNHFRIGGRPPNGEMMIEAQTRVVIELQRLHCEFPNEIFAIFSHGDPLKSAIAYFLGMSLNSFEILDISMASFSILSWSNWGAQLTGFNLQAD